jgi:hypothetical protein
MAKQYEYIPTPKREATLRPPRAHAENDPETRSTARGGATWIGFRVAQRALDASSATAVGLKTVKGHADVKDAWLTYEAMVFTDFYEESSDSKGTYAKRKGLGVRLEVHATDVKADLELSFLACSLAASGGLARCDYDIYGLGVTARDFIEKLPGPGQFGPGALKSLSAGTGAALGWLAEHADSAEPVEITEFISKRQAEDDFDIARATLFAAKRVAKGVALEDALREAAAKGLDGDVVASTYAFFTEDYTSTPVVDQPAKTRAHHWLKG